MGAMVGAPSALDALRTTTPLVVRVLPANAALNTLPTRMRAPLSAAVWLAMEDQTASCAQKVCAWGQMFPGGYL